MLNVVTVCAIKDKAMLELRIYYSKVKAVKNQVFLQVWYQVSNLAKTTKGGDEGAVSAA